MGTNFSEFQIFAEMKLHQYLGSVGTRVHLTTLFRKIAKITI